MTRIVPERAPWSRQAVSLVLVSLALVAATPAQAADPVVAAVGDIACDPAGGAFNGGLGTATNCRQKYVADRVATEAGVGAVLALGDVQYEHGSLFQFQNSYDLSWGRFNGKTRPAIGNHEYFEGSGTPRGSGYFDYFNGIGQFTGKAGDRDKGYYSFDEGAWHLLALNSVCQEVGGCAQGSPQDQWLRSDLATHPTSCTLAYWHHPRYSSGGEGNEAAVADMWQTLYEHGADLVLSGHAHSYERFTPQNATGNADTQYGIRQFVVGTGGKSLGGFPNIRPNSEFRYNDSYGYLKLTLHSSSYDWVFKSETGATIDSGTESCHGAPPGGSPTVQTGSATSVEETSVRLNGTVNPQAHSEASYHFEYGATDAYGSTTEPQPVTPVNTAFRQVGATLSGLTPGETYHYRVVATSDAGTTYGDNRTVTLGSATDDYAHTVETTPGLRSYWRLGEATGRFEFDQKGLELGTFLGDPALSQPGAVGSSDTSMAFDGVDDEMSATGPVIAAAGTVEGWFRWTGGKTLMRDDSWGGGWVLAYENSSGNLGYRVGGTVFSTGRNVSIARDGTWHHIAITKSGAEALFYLDGRLLHDPVGTADSDPASGPWHIMKNGQRTEYASGQADEVAVYDSALPAETIKAHYNTARPDATPPETTVTGGPPAFTQNASPSFTFVSTETLSSFRCRLDGPDGASGTESSCTSPRAYGGLVDGQYTFRVYAIDYAGNADPTPATLTFTVDRSPPETTIASGPSGTVKSQSASFSFVSSESGSTFECRLDGSAWSICTSPKAYTGLSRSKHTFEVRATDPAGNLDVTPAVRTWTVKK